MKRMITGLLIGASLMTGGLATAQDGGGFTAAASRRGNQVVLEVSGLQGLVCSGRAESAIGKSGGKSGGSGDARIRLSCNDGSKASADVRRDEARGEWAISFLHKEHGRAALRAVEK